ncbi:hypothetical protein F6455_06980 [Proteobacteria bacterium 005FR1]|nr:hypothetical protein [Proteobacteria bacterium 005FR1]
MFFPKELRLAIHSICLVTTIGSAAYAQAQASEPTVVLRPEAREWLKLSFENQSRFETLAQDINGEDHHDQVLVVRSIVKADMDFQPLDVTIELLDARADLQQEDMSLNSSMVNPLDILQAYVEVGGDTLSAKFGRFTQDIGSRRFMARNRFRNTINAFDGINALWRFGDEQSLRAFYSLPVERRFAGDAADNRMKTDRSHSNQRFWGLVYESKQFPLDSGGEVFLFGLDEDDDEALQTRNRELYSLGARVFRRPSVNRFDHEVEALYQTGDSRKTAAASDLNTLDHSAHFVHAEVGYSFDAAWQPRLQLHYDYASGDDSLTDSDNNLLDSLYGTPRGDFGPTGIYKIFTRSNISSPGVRLQLRPSTDVSWETEVRDVRLADDDLTSDSRHQGTQLELRVRWEAIPGRLRIETGGAFLNAGSGMEAQGTGDKSYLYLQSGFKF